MVNSVAHPKLLASMRQLREIDDAFDVPMSSYSYAQINWASSNYAKYTDAPERGARFSFRCIKDEGVYEISLVPARQAENLPTPEVRKKRNLSHERTCIAA